MFRLGTTRANAAGVTRTDRTFRALAREQPDIVLALLRASGESASELDMACSPDEVGDPQLDRPAAAIEADSVLVFDDVVRHTELQGYRDTSFEDRLFRYHIHLAVRHWPKPVRTLAVWLFVPSERTQRHRIERGAITVAIRSLVVPEQLASALLMVHGAACFAAGGREGRWTERTLCDRVVAALIEQRASARQQQMAILAAHSHSLQRYRAFQQAVRRAKMPDIILEDFVKIGEDIGVQKGLVPLLRMFARRLGRPLTDHEAQTLAARLDSLGGDRLGDVVLDLDTAALRAWLADPGAVLFFTKRLTRVIVVEPWREPHDVERKRFGRVARPVVGQCIGAARNLDEGDRQRAFRRV